MLKLPHSDHAVVIPSILFLGLLAGILIGYATAQGPWAYSDSTAYLSVAATLIKGGGLGMLTPSGAFLPLLHYPPFYPMALSLPGVLGLPLIAAARWLNILLFALLNVALSLTLLRLTRSLFIAFSLPILEMVSPVMLSTFTGIMSDPLALFTGMIALLLILLYLNYPRRSVLAAAALMAGLAFLTRYLAGAFLLTGLLAVAFLNWNAGKNRRVDLLIFASVAGALALAWLAWVYLQSHTFGNRNFQSVGALLPALTSLRATLADLFWKWIPLAPSPLLLSYRLKILTLSILALVIFLIPCLALVFGGNKGARKEKSTQPALFAQGAGFKIALFFDLFIGIYILVLLASVLFSVPTPDVNDRMLAPVNFALWIAIFVPLFSLPDLWKARSSWTASKARGAWGFQGLVLLVVCGVAVANFAQTSQIAARMHQDPDGYTSTAWRTSPTLAAVKQLPAGVPIVTNESALLLFHTGRSAYDISELLDNRPQSLDLRYGDNLQDTSQKIFREQGAALVIFNTIDYPLQLLYQADAPQRKQSMLQGLYLYRQYADGAIYFYRTPNWK
jgi:hypothetical protein